MNYRRKAIVFEGPAGSGKTYLMNQLMHQFRDQVIPEVDLLPEIERPRQYIGEHGRWHAQLKDYRSTLHMLMADDRVAMIDRWGVSRLVYDAIRSGQHVIEPDALAYSLSMMVYGLQQAWSENFASRDLQVPTLELDLLFIVVCSPGALITRLRQPAIDSGRIYPYQAEYEAKLYRQAAFALVQWSLEEIRRTNFVCRTEVVSLYTSNLDDRGSQASRAVERLIDYDHIPSLPQFPPVGLVSEPSDVTTSTA